MTRARTPEEERLWIRPFRHDGEAIAMLVFVLVCLGTTAYLLLRGTFGS